MRVRLFLNNLVLLAAGDKASFQRIAYCRWLPLSAELALVEARHKGNYERNDRVGEVCHCNLLVLEFPSDPVHRAGEDRDHQAKSACQAAGPQQHDLPWFSWAPRGNL